MIKKLYTEIEIHFHMTNDYIDAINNICQALYHLFVIVMINV